ncbi:hypothetical protein LUZ60_000925 [Juncus effusus]|nr:hypothetical protein LUZ60_000925 [Juncus effusus]
MARPRKKGAAATATARKPPLPPKPDDPVAGGPTEDPQNSFNERLVERRIAAIEAIREAETENLISRLRFVRSYMTSEQLETPALKFFEENFPNLSVTRNEKYKVLDLKWKEIDAELDGLYGNGGPATTGGLLFSVDSVKKSFLEATQLHYPDFNWDELAENQVAGVTSSMQTPGAMSGGISYGMTPKTMRVPKQGEMLLSVRGSPLGVYKEDDNLAAIHESEDGSPD